MPNGPVSAIVHTDMLPLGALAFSLSPHQRALYARQVSLMQDRLAQQIEALGGVVRGRFLYASTGLAVDIDVNRTRDVLDLRGVEAVRSVAQYELDLSDTVPWIGAATLQNEFGGTGQGVSIAFIDTGVDYTHAKLGGPGTKEAYNLDYCGDPAVDPFDPTTGVCAPAYDQAAVAHFPNAKVVGGHDYIGEVWPNPDPDCGSASNPLVCIVPDPNPIDIHGHGTHVADIAAGLSSSGVGAAPNPGVAPGAEIWAFKACSALTGTCDGLALLLALDDAMDLDGDTETYDPADVINLSLGKLYGQPEDDLTLFVNMASYYGSLVVTAAGNNGDRPYIVSAPSTASAALSVAQTTMPNEHLYAIELDDETYFGGNFQPWSQPITTQLFAPVQYGNGAGGNRDGCSAYATSLIGTVLLVDRGDCSISAKVAHATAAGATLMLIANNQFSNVPPVFAYSGEAVEMPVLTVTQNDAATLKALLTQSSDLHVSVTPDHIIALPDDIAATSSRGPRIADGAIKPDIAAPGASISAVAGSGTGVAAFGGTSGAVPVVAGSAALIIEALRARGVFRPLPGMALENISVVVPLVKALLMNTAHPNTYVGGSRANGGHGFLSPITLQGAGRIDVLAAYEADTVAWDVTDFYVYYRQWREGLPVDDPCRVRLFLDVVFYYYLGLYPECAIESPFGNDFFRAWNAQTGSISFGYDGVSGFASNTRQIVIVNLSGKRKTYDLDAALRYDDDAGKGAKLQLSKDSVTIGPSFPAALVNVTMELRANTLRDWTLDAGQYGANGTNIYCDNPAANSLPIIGEPDDEGCPTLQMFEIDGFLNIDGGRHNTVHLPWQVLPEKVANTYLSGVLSSQSVVRLRNPSRFQAGAVDVFSLIEVSPNQCEVIGEDGVCLVTDYQPGIIPGLNASPVDLHELGVRSYAIPDLNARLGLVSGSTGALADEVVEFGLSVYDAPYRASHNFPVMFQVAIDADQDQAVDSIVFNADLARSGVDGRNAVFVCDSDATGDPAMCDPTDPVRPYFYTITDFNSQNWILPVPATAIGVASNRPFNFYVRAVDAYFTEAVTDCAPTGCAGFYTYQTGQPRYIPAALTVQTPRRGRYDLAYETSPAGATASPAQIGLLFLHRNNWPGRESDHVQFDP
jgi:hypothetical protein